MARVGRGHAIPGTHSQLVSYTSTGQRDPAAEALYLAAQRLDRYGFSGWIGPEPHGKSAYFTSDHGDLLNAHGGMHQKWYQAYEESIHVPLIISNPAMFKQPRSIDALTSHVDLLPTMLGLAGADANALLSIVSGDHSDALPLVGRNLSAVVTGATSPATLTEPLYFMTDDDPSRGLNQDNWTGISYNSVTQPNHIEAVIATLNGEVWKYARYFDNPQFWSTPNDPNDPTADPPAEDIVLTPASPLPPSDESGPSCTTRRSRSRPSRRKSSRCTT